MNSFIDWALSNKTELAGTIFGLTYVLFSIRQTIFTWPAGIITSMLYCLVFLEAKFYAGMGLQLYYIIISVYGWWSWTHGDKSESGEEELKVSHTSQGLWKRLFGINLILNALMYLVLQRYTDSPIPFWDAFTTSMSVVATWMLARKKLEHWLIWIFIDLVSASVYFYRGLYSTVFLFLVYSIMAGIGFYEWQKEPQKVSC